MSTPPAPLSTKSCTPCRGDIPAARPGSSRGSPSPDTRMGHSRRGAPDRADVQVQEFRRGVRLRRGARRLAEAEGHHPDISFGWGYATISLQTNKIKGLHENDFIMAAKLDRMADQPARRRSRSRVMIDVRQTAPAAERNKGPILAVLKHVLPSSGLVLELASGTGQHVVHFAREMPHLTWQPTEPDPGSRIDRGLDRASGPAQCSCPARSRRSLRAMAAGQSAGGALHQHDPHLSVGGDGGFDGRGGPRSARARGVGALTARTGASGRQPAPSNEMFDEHLRSSNPEWSVRDLEAVVEMAQSNGLAMQDAIEMPANNLSVVFRPAPSRS